ncbi:MAG TPA: HNH endonuclease [Verrucomicrobiales bacterium]|jgi:uncharacterized protein (TIGR02646 family)|nr:HNH endonuclease [Verrucomicrobiales bacterium]
MRPINRGLSPIEGDFDNYRDAFPELMARLGPYCSYCERRMPTNLAVEHIQPKDGARYPELIGRWDNYVLGCVNCNGTKGDKDVLLEHTFLADRDNTFFVFQYLPDGTVSPRQGLPPEDDARARATLALPGLDKPINEVYDQNGRLVAIDRVGQRMEVWLLAEESRTDLGLNPSESLRRQICRTALASGFFSIWMTVFSGYPAMRRMFIEEFRGTSPECFDEGTEPVSPRPGNGLAHAGKI